jgi:enhancing lycopene biosynthesis protein 2
VRTSTLWSSGWLWRGQEPCDFATAADKAVALPGGPHVREARDGKPMGFICIAPAIAAAVFGARRSACA